VNVKVIIGCPGAGKSTYLARAANRLDPKKTIIVSFSRKAAKSINNKLGKEYRASTIHSYCCRASGIRPEDIITDYDISKEAMEVYNHACNITEEMITEESIIEACLHKGYYNIDEITDEISKYIQYKEDHVLYDFNDMLKVFTPYKVPENLLIDEAQDLYPALKGVIDRLIKAGLKNLWLVGDPDQCIYQFNGSDPKIMTSYGGEIKYLDQSHRCPEEVVKFAKQILPHARFKPTDNKGEVIYTDKIPKDAEVVLVRTKYVQVNSDKTMTMHKAKGLQWNRVAIYDDIGSTKVNVNNEEEKRLMYTAITRSRDVVYIVKGNYDYLYRYRNDWR